MGNPADSYERAWLAEKDFQIQMMEDILFDIRQVGWLEPQNSRIQKRIDEARKITEKIREDRIQRQRVENERRREAIRKETGEEVKWQEDHSTLNVNGSTSLGAGIITWWKTLFRRS